MRGLIKQFVCARVSYYAVSLSYATFESIGATRDLIINFMLIKAVKIGIFSGGRYITNSWCSVVFYIYKNLSLWLLN